MRLFISFIALFASISLLQLSSGAIGPLDVLSGTAEGFSNTEIGLLGSSHFFGFFIGCWWAPRLMGSVGHSRAFSAFAAFGAIGAIAHPLLIDPTAWAFMRILTGLCVAGCYTVIEAWMQARLTNSNRGRVMASYRTVDIVVSSAAQLMIGALEPASYVSYNLLAILCCACMLPVVLTKMKQPETPKAPRLRPINTFKVSPLGAAGVIVAGTSSAAFRMVGPIYGHDIGLNAAQIGSFLATVLIGGAIAQFPVGWLADKYDRRWVLIGLSVLGIIACSTLVATNSDNHSQIFLVAGLFGASIYPIFSVSTAHANDFANANNTVEINSSLMFLYGIGAIFSPLIASVLIQIFGPSALFAYISVAHVFLVGFGLWRMSTRPTEEKKTAYAYVPRTSFTVGKLLKRTKSR
jgi:MFS family permease